MASCLGNGGNKNIIKNILEYIYGEGASCLSNRGIKNIIGDIVEYINVGRASCLSNRWIKYVNDTRTKYGGGYHFTVRVSSGSNYR